MTRTDGDPGSGAGSDGEGGNTEASGVPGSRRLEKIAHSASSTAGSAYQGAMESVFAIVIATGIGYWADTKFGTSPRWLIVGAIVGFAAFVLRLARMARLVADPIESDPEAEKRVEQGESERDDEPPR